MIKSLKLFPNFPFFKIAFIFSTRVRRIFTETKLNRKTGLKTSVVILFAFLGGAAFPAVPYLLAGPLGFAAKTTFIVATCITVIGLFGAGAMKKFVTGVNWLKSGFEMLI